MDNRGWRTFRGLEAELVDQYGRTWWASSARFWLWTATVLIPTSVGVLLWNPAILRFPLRYPWFWMPFMLVMIPSGSIATVLCVASIVVGTRHQQWVGRRFTWLATAVAAIVIVLELGGMAPPLIVQRHGR